MVAPLETLSRTAVQPFGQRVISDQQFTMNDRFRALRNPIDPAITPDFNPNAPRPVVDFPSQGVPRTMPVLPPSDEPPPQFLAQQPITGNFGLSGAEQAIQQGIGSGLGTLMAGFGAGQNLIQQGVNLLGGAGGGGVSAQQAQAGQAGAVSFDPQTGQAQFREGISGIRDFSPAGLQAQQIQAAMSGALGREAQAQAFADFVESPEQAFIREQAELASRRGAAATGQLLSGRHLAELTRQGAGIAAQDIQNRFARLGQLSGQGLQAATAAGQLSGQAGALEANQAQALAQLQQQRNLQNAQMRTQAALQNAQLGTQAGIAGMQNRADLARAQASLLGQGAGLAAQLAGQGAGFQFTGGRDIGGLRMGAGQDIQRAIAAQAAGLSGLQQQQGTGISDLIGQSGVNLANILSGAGQTGDLANLGQLLSNQAIGQGSNIANALGNIGAAEAQGLLGRGQAQAGFMSDILGLTGLLAGRGAFGGG